ncbi:head-tail adaptor protein [Rhodobacteraceae bacterium W635]|uniref:phage head closure protein n=1 Tax=Nioella halotolerans TaxID=2303578 RepID=UPI000E3C221E|nr:head-tail adaptor protein [Rhodobacteraceae bacterium W635]
MGAPPNLSRRLLLEGPVRVADGAGGYTEGWAPLGQVWGEVKPRTGRDAAGLSRMGVKITVRAAPQGAPSRPTPSQRFRDGARLFHIDAVTESDPGGRFLICYATEEGAT